MLSPARRARASRAARSRARGRLWSGTARAETGCAGATRRCRRQVPRNGQLRAGAGAEQRRLLGRRRDAGLARQGLRRHYVRLRAAPPAASRGTGPLRCSAASRGSPGRRCPAPSRPAARARDRSACLRRQPTRRRCASGRRTVSGRPMLGPEPSHDAIPVSEPTLTTREVCAQAAEVLPGVRVRRLLFWRYLLVWHKPYDDSSP